MAPLWVRFSWLQQPFRYWAVLAPSQRGGPPGRTLPCSLLPPPPCLLCAALFCLLCAGRWVGKGGHFGQTDSGTRGPYPQLHEGSTPGPFLCGVQGEVAATGTLRATLLCHSAHSTARSSPEMTRGSRSAQMTGPGNRGSSYRGRPSIQVGTGAGEGGPLGGSVCVCVCLTACCSCGVAWGPSCLWGLLGAPDERCGHRHRQNPCHRRFGGILGAEPCS